MIVANRGIQSENEWMGTHIGTSIFFALLLIGHAFPAMRKKNSTMTFLTTPASLLEKYIFEVLVKMVLFTLLYPIMFKVAGELAVAFADFTFPKKKLILLLHTVD